jgi:hypothetical protein
MDDAHGMDSSVSSDSRSFETRKGTHAMRHLNSVFHSLLKLVPWHRFDRLVEKYEADAGTRKLTTKSQLVAMLYGQFAGISRDSRRWTTNAGWGSGSIDVVSRRRTCTTGSLRSDNAGVAEPPMARFAGIDPDRSKS